MQEGEYVLRRPWFIAPLFAFIFCLAPARSSAQENPYIVAYDHYMEEPGSLEVEYFSTFGTQRGGNDFHSFWTEFEYGATGWWTTEFYLAGQTTFNDSDDEVLSDVDDQSIQDGARTDALAGDALFE